MLQLVLHVTIPFRWLHSRQERDRVIAKATHLACFVLSIDRGSGCLNTAQHREKDGQEPHGLVPILTSTLPVAFPPVVSVVSLHNL
jgi:hypothetical protein